MVAHVQLTSDKEYWETPADFFAKLDERYHFTHDMAASDTNHKCANYFTEEDDSLNMDWDGIEGNLFLNPPYGRNLKNWVGKAHEESQKRDGKIVMLIPSRTDTSYWHEHIFGTADVIFLRGRLKFELDGEPRDAAPFGSALVIFDREAKGELFHE